MKLPMNSKLIDTYKKHNKNPNYSLSFLLSSVDPKTCVEVVTMVNTLTLAGEPIEFEIDEKNIRAMRNIFGNVDAALTEKLLWVALLFPEI